MEASRALRPDPDPDPRPAPAATARDRHALLSLAELASALSRTHDVHGAIDALLLNLMGHLGTARAAVCLAGPEPGEPPVPIRCHGLARPMMTVLMAAAWPELGERWRHASAALRLSTLTREEGAALTFVALAREAGVELLVPLRAHESVLGVLVLGWRVGGSPYAPLDLELIEASAAMGGMALRKAELHGQSLEIGRRQRAALEELAELNRMKSQLVDNLNHELRTPITVMMASLECLDSLPLGNEQAVTLVQHAQRGVKNLARVVQQLLTFSAGAKQQLEVHLVEEDLGVFLARLVVERRPGVSAGRRELHLEVAPRPAPAKFDPAMLRQVLDELIDNAVKFTPAGSAIRIVALDHVEAGLAWRRVEVRDNGPGIAEEQLPRLFTEFRQVDGSATRTVGGLGLGLAVARKLLEAMGARIEVGSSPGEGTVFAVVIPAADLP